MCVRPVFSLFIFESTITLQTTEQLYIEGKAKGKIHGMGNFINDEHERKIQNDNMKERMTTER